MGNITVKNINYRHLNLEILTFNSSRFRVVAELENRSLFLVTSSLLAVILEDLDLKSLLEINSKDNYWAAFYGSPYSFFIPCNKCFGQGTISWIDKIYNPSVNGRPTPSHFHTYNTKEVEAISKFVPQKELQFYEGTVLINDTINYALYRLAELQTEGYEYCDKCFGTGISIDSRILKLKDDYSSGDEIESPFNNISLKKIIKVKR